MSNFYRDFALFTLKFSGVLGVLSALGFGLSQISVPQPWPWTYVLHCGALAFCAGVMTGSVAFWFLLVLAMGTAKLFDFWSLVTGLIFMFCIFFTAYYRILEFPLKGLNSVLFPYIPALVSTFAFWKYSRVYILNAKRPH